MTYLRIEVRRFDRKFSSSPLQSYVSTRPVTWIRHCTRATFRIGETIDTWVCLLAILRHPDIESVEKRYADEHT